MWLFNKTKVDPPIEELRKKSIPELKAIIAQGNIESAAWFVRQLILLSEMEKRIHEMKFHGREGDEYKILELEKGINNIYQNIQSWLVDNVFQQPKT